jgi:hypothetical protein
VRNLALIIPLTICAVAAGIAITKTGHAVPFMTAGSTLSAISCGLFYSMDIGTSSGKWIGYQIISGVGVGIGFQTTIIVAQANAKAEDMSSVTAMIFCKSGHGRAPQ